ncbi:hypothetical protein PFISCL1PPCAC_14933 [Pristionchus fissidentatus]|uniref:Copper transport protein n=1 Tax=Pristionchus fissidentatus TaxID=1538716 RepID=A0AAV5VVU7_9BILA|nr:hypothetical protein PFISCL1PPCAC_14933 [Pristionchus fissidentatus]
MELHVDANLHDLLCFPMFFSRFRHCCRILFIRSERSNEKLIKNSFLPLIEHSRDTSVIALPIHHYSLINHWSKYSRMDNMTVPHPYIQMYFHFRENEPLLFWEWLPSDTTDYVFSCIGIALISITYEFLRFIRYKVQNEERERRTTPMPESCCCVDSNLQPIVTREYSHFSSLLNSHHIADSVLCFIQLYGSYTLMIRVGLTRNFPHQGITRTQTSRSQQSLYDHQSIENVEETSSLPLVFRNSTYQQVDH